jgi:pimeloyl-ACP methyl ester carboxylesterase
MHCLMGIALAVLLAASCTSVDDPARTSRARSPGPTVALTSPTSPQPTKTSPPKPRFVPKLTKSQPCPDVADFRCSILEVPLERSSSNPKTIGLQVAVAEGPAPRGVLLFLSGGPGQLGVGFVPPVLDYMQPLFEEYRLVMLDQRGTGNTAIECAGLQETVGGSDLLAPPPSAVRSCINVIGSNRSFYTTADTVADLDLLRQALGVNKWTIDGVSYGSYVAEHYALTYPNHVRALVLDSVVPHDGFDTFLRQNLRRSAYVLRDVCADGPACDSDPAKDLAWVIRHGGDGVGILNALTIASILDPTFRELIDVPDVLHQARLGDPSGVEKLIEEGKRWGMAPTPEFSAGLHLATICSDLEYPWGDSATPLNEREGELEQVARDITTRAVWPFDRATAIGTGLIQACLQWPPIDPEMQTGGELPDVPTLLLQGERDLSTPPAWSRREAALAPKGKLVVIPNEGHSVQIGTENEAGREAVYDFLLRDS